MIIDRDLVRPNDRWFSDRGIPLITQPLNLPLITDSVISVERYEKWYCLYAVHPGSAEIIQAEEVTPKNFPTYDPNDMWRDHTIVPAEFVMFVKSAGAKIDLQTYDAICRRYIQDWYEHHTVFTREFCLDIAVGGINGNCFDPDNYPTEDDLQSVLVRHDINLTI